MVKQTTIIGLWVANLVRLWFCYRVVVEISSRTSVGLPNFFWVLPGASARKRPACSLRSQLIQTLPDIENLRKSIWGSYCWKHFWSTRSGTARIFQNAKGIPNGFFYPAGGGGTRMARGGIRLVHGLTKSTLIKYFSGMKTDPKYAFLHAFFLISLSRSFQNLSIWLKTHLFFPILHVFAPLNDVRAYSAWSWKTTIITWIFGRAWYPGLTFECPPGFFFYSERVCLDGLLFRRFLSWKDHHFEDF